MAEEKENIIKRILGGFFVFVMALFIIGYFMPFFNEVLLGFLGWDKIIVGIGILVIILSGVYYFYKRVTGQEIKIE